MNARADMERNGIIMDLNNICRELEQIAAELKQIKGIGAEKCSSQLIHISNKYNIVKNQL